MKKNVAGQVVGAGMTLLADGTAFTGAVTCYVTLDNGSQTVGSVGSGAATSKGNGYYTYAPSQAETNGDYLAYTFVGTGAAAVTVAGYTTFPQTADVGVQNWGYIHGAVWIDSLNGAAGTTVRTNGIATNPVTSIAQAKTIADNLKLKRFWIQAGSSLSLSADMAGYVFDGKGWGLSASSSRDVSGSTIIGCEVFTGIYAAAVREFYIVESQIGDCTLGEVDIHRSHIVGTITLKANAAFLLDNCVGVPIPPATPTLNFNSTADARAAVVSNYGGILTVTNMRAGNLLYLDGNCDLILDVSCTGGTVYLAGAIRLTNNSAATLVDAARWAEDQNLYDLTIKTGFSLSSLPAAPTDWLTAAAVKADAVTKLQSGMATQTSVNAIPTTPLLADNYTVPPTVAAIRAEMDANSTKLTNLDATISSRMASFTYTAPDNASITAIKAKTDNLPASFPANFASLGISSGGKINGVVLVDTTTTLTNAPSGGLDAAGVRAAVGLASANLDTQLAAKPALTGIVNGVLDALLIDHTIPGSVAVGISNASAAGNPWEYPFIIPDTDPVETVTAGELQFQLYVPPALQPIIPIPAPPSDVNECRVYLDTKDLGSAKHYGKTITFTLSAFPAVNDDRGLETAPITLTTDATGYLTGTLQRSDTTLPAGRTYHVSSDDFGLNLTGVELTTPTFNLIALFT